ncbi:MAG: hypothetical protein QJT81_15170 [Candidatus Thiothrix putei]|uniref:Amino acid permease n=1 Tax=Candidatus Thiothrix putei TaxID=3080811 RepID=A0AA95KKR9_9GAMM|nr:MAG: hypothetical protein QJT81_15170 [Candidatus Thiothrix putei]
MDNNPHTHGKVGLFSALGIGIGGMVGGGIFAVQGEAILLAKQATPLAFMLGGILALITFAGVAVASGFIFIAFQGFELIANAIRDIQYRYSEPIQTYS